MLYPPSPGVTYKGDGDTRPVITGDDTRDQCIAFRDKSNLTFIDIIAEHAKYQCIFGGANAADVSGIQFIRLETRYGGSGIQMFTELADKSITEVLFDEVVARHNQGTGLSCALHGGGNILYRDCMAFSNALNAPAEYTYTAGLYAISLDADNRLVNVVWDGCRSFGNGIGAVSDQAGHGIWFDHAGPGAEIKNAVSIGNKSGVYFEMAGQSPNTKLHNNVVGGNDVGVLIARGCHGVDILGNVGFNNKIGMQVSGQWGGGDPIGMVGNVVRSNTILNSIQQALMAVYGGETGNIYQDNTFNPEATGFVEYGKDVLYDTIADWEAAIGTVEGNRS